MTSGVGTSSSVSNGGTTAGPAIVTSPRPHRCRVPAGRVSWRESLAPSAGAAVGTSAYPDRAPDAAHARDRDACLLRAARERVVIPLAHAARAFVEKRGWTRHGFARREDFGRECFRRSGRWLGDLAALGRGLQRLPLLQKALLGDDGERPLGQVAATLIARTATRESAGAWIAVARQRTVRELRALVAEARACGATWPVGKGPGEPLADRGSPAVPPQGGSDARPWDASTAPDPDAEDRCTVRFASPSPVRAAFDEALELYRAVEGAEVTVTAFVEALTADAASGGFAFDDTLDRVVPRPGVADRENALAARSARWAGLGTPSAAGSSVVAEIIRRLRELEASAASARAGDLPAEIDALLALEADIDQRLGAVLLAMTEKGDWWVLGFADAGHYAEERLGISRSAAKARVRLARAARRHAALRSAYDGGQLGQQAALLVAQVLGQRPVEPTVERRWVNGALGCTVKRLRDEVRWASGRMTKVRGGDNAQGPTFSSGLQESTAPPGIGSALLAADASAERAPFPGLTFSSGAFRTTPPLPPTDAEWHASLRRDPGRARERVIEFTARALATPVEDDVLRLTLPETTARDFLATIEAHRRALEADGATIGTGPLPAWAGLLGLLLDFVATWDAPRGFPKRANDAIYRRDGWRCMAPGCTSRRNLEEHHVRYRSRGGSDDESNRVALCRFHHQQGEHGGAMRVRGTAPLGLVWRLGPAGSGAWYRNEKRYFAVAAG